MGRAKQPRTPRPPAGGATLHGHPRAQRDLLRARGWGGMLAFLLVGWLSMRAGADPADALARALAAGLVGLVAAWACALLAWHALARAELRVARDKALARAAEARQVAEEARRPRDERRGGREPERAGAR